MIRSDQCLKKVDRVHKTLNQQQPDRIPQSDFFWSTFISRWQQELGLPKDASPYTYYDMDWITTTPNMDPHIKGFEIIEESEEDIIIKTGYEATIRKKEGVQMPYFLEFETNTLEKMKAFQFDDPWDDRRFFAAGDNQLAGISDVITRNVPAWIDGVKSAYSNMAVFGSVCEAHEQLWRIVGSENVMLWIGLYPDELGLFIDRVSEFLIEMTKAQIEAADGMLDGMVVWGDVAYKNGMLFSPDYWRKHFKPCVKEIIKICHDHNLDVIYHGCGNASVLYDDFVEIGLNAYNPLEAKAGLDVVELRKKYKGKLGFCGNIDVMTWADAPLDELAQDVVRKVKSAEGGGYLPQSDHSVPSNVSAERFEFVHNLIKKHGDFSKD